MDEQDELGSPRALVSSLYGPGVVLAWILSLVSVLIGWTINKRRSTVDSINSDHFVALAYPVVAAGHAIYLLFHYGLDISSIHDADRLSATEAERRHSFTRRQQFEAVRAPIAICFIFYDVGIMLLYIAHRSFIRQIKGRPGKDRIPGDAPLKRGLFVSIAWLASAFASILYCFVGPKKDVYLLETTSTVLMDTAMSLIMRHERDNTEDGDWVSFLALFNIILVGLAVLFYMGMLWIARVLVTIRMALLTWARYKGHWVQLQRIWLSIEAQVLDSHLPYDSTSVLFIFSQYATFIGGLLSQFFGASFWGYIPRSNNSISELDQAFSLGAGLACFLYWFRDMVRSRREESSGVRRRATWQGTERTKPRNKVTLNHIGSEPSQEQQMEREAQLASDLFQELNLHNTQRLPLLIIKGGLNSSLQGE